MNLNGETDNPDTEREIVREYSITALNNIHPILSVVWRCL